MLRDRTLQQEGDYSSILGFAAQNVNGPDAPMCNGAERNSVRLRKSKAEELKDRNDRSKRN